MTLRKPRLLIGISSVLGAMIIIAVIMLITGNLSILREESGWKIAAGSRKKLETRELYVQMNDKEECKEIPKVYVFPFSLSDPRDTAFFSEEFIEALTEKYCIRLGEIYQQVDLLVDTSVANITNANAYIGTHFDTAGNYGILLGKFVSIKDEIPAKSRKAEISSNMILYDKEGIMLWGATLTYTGTGIKSGIPLSDHNAAPAVTALELLEISTSDLIRELNRKSRSVLGN